MTRALEGNTAVVAGGSRGIGLAVARVLVGAGVRTTLLARNARELEARTGELGGGNAAHAIRCDLRDRADVERATLAIRERFGEAPDILVNSAGVFHLARVEEFTDTNFADALAVNLVAPFRLMRAFLPEMRQRHRGHIVSIGSVADHTTFPENGAYAASKHGLRALHNVLRAELHGSGVRATLVSPGPVDTSLWDSIDPPPERREGFTPRERMLEADSVAAAVMYALLQPPTVNVDLVRLSRS
jgi:NADP-dependent 3-hydroxy acid dehydrogenase YdfG